VDARMVKFGLRLLNNKLRAKHTPFIVQLTLLNSCNYQCTYCYAEYYKRGGKQMALDQVRFILDRLADAGTFRVNLLGGEPLLRKDIGTIVDYGRDKGLLMVMNTNGYFVRKKMDIIRKLYSVCISLDGEEKANDLNRGAGTFQKIMDGVTACEEQGIPVNFSAVLTRHSCDQVDFMVDMARRYKGFVDFTTLISQEREGNSNNESVVPTREQVDTALRRIIELRRAGAPIGFTTKAYEHALQWPDFAIPFFQGQNPAFNDVECFAGRDYIFIDYNGDIYPCPQRVGIIRHGNIFTDGFEEAYRIAAGHNCRACPQPCTTDLSLFFSMKPAALASKIRQGGVFRRERSDPIATAQKVAL
jgi:MoaA/NifB/PqqE/SkfB family radical SAM enzyme